MPRSPPPPTWSRPRCVGLRSPRRPRLASTPTSTANVRATPPPRHPAHTPNAHTQRRAPGGPPARLAMWRRVPSGVRCAAGADGLATEDPAWLALVEAADRLGSPGDGDGGGGGGGGGDGGGDGVAEPSGSGAVVVVSSASLPPASFPSGHCGGASLPLTAPVTHPSLRSEPLRTPHPVPRLAATPHSLLRAAGDPRLPSGHGRQRQHLP